MYLNVELMEYEYSVLSKTSEISDPSNTISFDYVYIEPETTPIPTIQAPKPTNMKLSEDYVLTYECNFENITKYDDTPPRYIDGNTGLLFFPLLYVYVYYEAPDGSVVVSEPNYGSVCRLENNVGSIDLSYQIENDYEEMNLNGPYKVYCSMYLNSELMDYEYGGLSKESEMSDYSNAVMISNTIPIESIVISPSQPVISLNNSYYLVKMV